MTIPRDFLDEIDRELRESSRRVADAAFKVSQLVELHRLALQASLRRGRPVSVVDVFEDVPDEDEHDVLALVRSLRGDDA